MLVVQIVVFDQLARCRIFFTVQEFGFHDAYLIARSTVHLGTGGESLDLSSLASKMGKCCCMVFIAIVALVIAGLTIGISLGIKKAKHTVKEVSQSTVSAACQATSYPETCNKTLSGSNYTTSSKRLTRYSVQSANTGVASTLNYTLGLNGTNPNITDAVDICTEVLGLSIEQLESAAAALKSSNFTIRQKALDDLKASVSAAMELHTTCIDAVMEVSYADGLQLQQQSNYTDQLLSNALAFINALAAYGNDTHNWKPTEFSLPNGLNLSDLSKNPIFKFPGLGNRRLLSSDLGSADECTPNWLDTQMQRHLLLASTYDVVVAKDGSGNYTTIQKAMQAHSNNTARLVIYIKAGIYNEQVTVPKSATSITFIGDGNSTIITGNRSVALTKRMTTYKSATLIIAGNGFIGRNFRVENTAGSLGHQAVAVRVSADKVAFYQCTFDGWQDTLYAHTYRHFYRECKIYGTVDFIFGNAAASFQSCNLIAKKTTLFGQQNTYTAQGRTDTHQSTGLSFQNCTFDGTTELKGNTTYYKTYLGRPWKAYSVSVILKSQLMGHIDPTGWLPWNSSTFGLYTSFLAEYRNYGAGSNTTGRVSWSHQINNVTTAEKYQASNFIDASAWVTSYNIPYTATL